MATQSCSRLVAGLTHNNCFANSIHGRLGHAACPERMAAEFVHFQTRPLSSTLQEFADGILVQTPSRYMSVSTYRTEDRAFFNSGLVEPLSERADRTCILTGSERQLRRAYHNGADRDARHDMTLASLFCGLALANAGLGVVHGFAAPLGGQWKAPHGALCAALLPHGMAANVAGLRARAPQHPAIERYSTIARLLTGRGEASVEDGIDWVRALSAELSISGLSAWGVTEADLQGVVEKAAKASSMQANPLPLTEEELIGVVWAAL